MIETMKEADLKAVSAIEKELFSDAWNYEQFLYEIRDNPFSYFYVLRNSDVIIGYLGVNILFERAEISVIAVKKEYQNRGFGYKLLQKAIALAIQKGCEILSLEVRVSNHKALDLYQRNGFVIMRKRLSYYSDYEDAYEMAKPIGGLDAKDFSD